MFACVTTWNGSSEFNHGMHSMPTFSNEPHYVVLLPPVHGKKKQCKPCSPLWPKCNIGVILSAFI